jgi:hypothetical protein
MPKQVIQLTDLNFNIGTAGTSGSTYNTIYTSGGGGGSGGGNGTSPANNSTRGNGGFPGDLFVGHCTEIHGALPVKEYLCAMMFKINA